MRLPDKTCWEMLAIANSSKRVKLNVMSISSNTLSIFARWKHVLTQVLDGDVVMMGVFGRKIQHLSIISSFGHQIIQLTTFFREAFYQGNQLAMRYSSNASRTVGGFTNNSSKWSRSNDSMKYVAPHPDGPTIKMLQGVLNRKASPISIPPNRIGLVWLEVLES